MISIDEVKNKSMKDICDLYSKKRDDLWKKIADVKFITYDKPENMKNS